MVVVALNIDFKNYFIKITTYVDLIKFIKNKSKAYDSVLITDKVDNIDFIINNEEDLCNAMEYIQCNTYRFTFKAYTPINVLSQ